MKQLNLTTAERKRIESSLSDERQLVLDLVEFRAALQEITRITSLKTIERDNKAREYLKAEVCVHLAQHCSVCCISVISCFIASSFYNYRAQIGT